MKQLDAFIDTIGAAAIHIRARHIAAVMQIGWALSLLAGRITGGAFAYLADLLDLSIAQFKIYGAVWFFAGAFVLMAARTNNGKMMLLGTVMFTTYITLGYGMYAVAIDNGSPAVAGFGILLLYILKAGTENGHTGHG